MTTKRKHALVAERKDTGGLNGDDLFKVAAIHASGYMLNMSVAGAGYTAIAKLFALPGASSIMYGVMMPYHSAYTHDYYRKTCGYDQNLDKLDVPAVSKKSTDNMASSLWFNMNPMSHDVVYQAGVAVSAALQTNRERRGSDHVWMSVFTHEGMQSQHLDLTGHDRATQEQIVSDSLIHFLIKCLGVEDLVSDGVGVNPWLEGRVLE